MVVDDFLHRAQLFSIFGQSAELGTGRFLRGNCFWCSLLAEDYQSRCETFWMLRLTGTPRFYSWTSQRNRTDLSRARVYNVFYVYIWLSLNIPWYSWIGCLILDSCSLLKKYNISSPTYICLNLYQLPIDFRSKFTRQRFTGPISGGGGGRTPTVFQKILFCDHTKSEADTRWVQFSIGSLCKLPGKEALDKILKGAIFWSQPKISLPPISSPYLLAPFCKDLTTGNKIANGTF